MAKNKKNKKNKDIGKSEKFIESTTFVSREDTKFDPSGSYTGVPNEVFYDNVEENPVQDADDL